MKTLTQDDKDFIQSASRKLAKSHPFTNPVFQFKDSSKRMYELHEDADHRAYLNDLFESLDRYFGDPRDVRGF